MQPRTFTDSAQNSNQLSHEPRMPVPRVRNSHLTGADAETLLRYFPTEPAMPATYSPAHQPNLSAPQTAVATSRASVPFVTSVYVNGLAPHVDSHGLHDVCKMFGALSATVLRDPTFGSSSCSGFIAFPDFALAERFIEQTNSQHIPALGPKPIGTRLSDSTKRSLGLGRSIGLGRSRPPQRSSQLSAPYPPVSPMHAAPIVCAQPQKGVLPPTTIGTRLFVGSLPFEVGREWLHRAFEPYGRVLCAVVPSGHKGFGFVVMETLMGAMNAIDALDGAMTDNGQVLRVEISRK